MVLATRHWDGEELCDVEIEETGGSRVFPYEGQERHAVMRGINLESLKRWNGLPGTVAVASMRVPDRQGVTPILWVREPGFSTLVEVPIGRGRLLFSQLDVRGHVLPAKDHYDPAADRFLLNLLAP